MIVKDEVYKGFWFLPDNLDNKIPGILYFEAKKEIRLELIGGFETNISEILDSKDNEIIFGVTNKNEKISLINCFGPSSINFPSEFQTTIYKCQYFVKGLYLHDKNQPIFERIKVDLTYLYEWYPPGLIKNKIIFSEDKNAQEITISMNKADIWERIFDIDSDYKLRIFGIGNFNSNYNNSKYNFSQNTLLEIIHNNSKDSFLELLGKVNIFKQFLSLATFSRIHFNHLTFFLNSDYQDSQNKGKIDNSISLYLIENNELNHKDRPKQFLFLYSEIKDIFPDIIKKWYQEKHSLAPIRNHLINSIQIKNQFTSFDFLIIIQSLEGYHTRFVDKKDKYLKDRISELNNIFAGVSEISSTPINLDNVIDSRNYYSHFFERNKKKNVLEGNDLYYLTIQLKKLLTCCVLYLIGFDINLIDIILNKSKDMYK